MTMTHQNDDMLDDIFAQARDEMPVPSDALMARVLGDAASVQSAARALPTVAKQGLWARAMDAIGGWPALSGLAAATVAGVWIGVAPPASVSAITASLVGDEVSVDLFQTTSWLDVGVLGDG